MLLKRIRQILAVLVMLGITCYFLDFWGILSHKFHFLEHIQLGPALLSGGMIALVAAVIVIVLSLVFGRIYCSVICPLGIFQDVINRIALAFNKKKKFKYIAENKGLRISFLVFFFLVLVFNIAFLVALIEPYSIYGRFVNNLFLPVFAGINNVLAYIFNRFGNYSLYHIEVYIASVSSFIIALVSLVIIVALAFKNGRIYCNTVCPVGTMLGYVSRFALLKPYIDVEKCNGCTVCSRKCKASCIDAAKHRIDYSRCVDCFDCLTACKQGAIRYTWFPGKTTEKEIQKRETGGFASRRYFLALSSLMVATAVEAKVVPKGKISRGNSPRKQPIVPPGGLSAENLIDHCTACHLCVSKCPSKVIKPAFTEYGFSGIMLPMLSYEKGFCNFDCTLCSDICPAHALKPITREEKHKLKLGEVHFDVDRCIVHTDHTSCGACSEHCPTQAVSMVKYEGELTIPHIEQDLCVGCGGCESVCPAIPQKAIYVEGLSEHGEARKIEENASERIVLEDFGF